MREQFVCPTCKLQFAGRVLTDGRIVPCDRSATSSEPIQEATCFECLERAAERKERRRQQRAREYFAQPLR